MLADFHFIQPLWLLALLPLALLWWLSTRPKSGGSKAWANVIDAKLLPLLLSGDDKPHRLLPRILLALAWLLTVLALADPVWQKIPRPVFQTNSARVVVLDLSSSMLIADLKPSRLARARFKIEDILSSTAKQEEGQIGLVLFAGDAFTASPLTRDAETIRSLLHVLKPSLMPSQGSRVDRGLRKAKELLEQAGINNGQVLLIADGVSHQPNAIKQAQALKQAGHTLSVLGVGTEKGGTLPRLKYRNGKPITVKLNASSLQEIAQQGGGKYHLITTNNTDLRHLLSRQFNSKQSQIKNDEIKNSDWKSTGPLLILLLLPIAALAFRRGWLLTVFLAISLLSLLQPQPVMAETLSETLNETWKNLWTNKEQQAEEALKKQQYDKASVLSQDPLTRGTAQYKTKNYPEALDNFKQAKGADARYNEGNALAKLGKLKDAINAYDKALKLQPNMEDAIKNKAAVEKILKQKQQSSKNKNDKNKQQKSSQKKDGQNNDQKQGQEKEDKNKSGKQGDKDKKTDPKKDGKQGENQFSDANKNLDNKKEGKEQQDDHESPQKDPQGKNSDKKDKKSSNKKSDKKDKQDANKQKGKPSKSNDEKNNAKEDQKTDNAEKEGTKTEAKALSKEEKMAAEQWLRRIPDDPGGLLRRKFRSQYQRRKQPNNITDQPW